MFNEETTVKLNELSKRAKSARECASNIVGDEAWDPERRARADKSRAKFRADALEAEEQLLELMREAMRSGDGPTREQMVQVTGDTTTIALWGMR